MVVKIHEFLSEKYSFALITGTILYVGGEATGGGMVKHLSEKCADILFLADPLISILDEFGFCVLVVKRTMK